MNFLGTHTIENDLHFLSGLINGFHNIHFYMVFVLTHFLL